MPFLGVRLLKVLQVWDTSVVGSTIAKYASKISKIKIDLIHRAGFSYPGLTHWGKIYNDGPKIFIIRSILKSNFYDIIHIHDIDVFIKYLNEIYYLD